VSPCRRGSWRTWPTSGRRRRGGGGSSVGSRARGVPWPGWSPALFGAQSAHPLCARAPAVVCTARLLAAGHRARTVTPVDPRTRRNPRQDLGFRW